MSAKDDFVLTCTHFCIVHLIDKQALAPDDDWVSNNVRSVSVVILRMNLQSLSQVSKPGICAVDYNFRLLGMNPSQAIVIDSSVYRLI